MLLSASRNGGLPSSDDIRSEFDLVVIDAPSLAEQPEVAALSAHADLVILVVRDGAADPAAIRKARASLAKFGGAAIGIVVNQVGPRTATAQPRTRDAGNGELNGAQPAVLTRHPDMPMTDHQAECRHAENARRLALLLLAATIACFCQIPRSRLSLL